MRSDGASTRVLVFAPIGRDGPASAELLRRTGLNAEPCADLAGLVEALEAGAAAAFVAEEGLFGQDLAALAGWVERQPTWSDLPFVVLTSRQEQPAITAWRQGLAGTLRNVSFLERPLQAITLASALRAAVRARMRQYEIRDLLAVRERAAQQLEVLVEARTRELEEANRELRTQMAERAQAEQSLRQAQKLDAIGQLTGGVAHDFNNLLQAIAACLRLLARKTRDPELAPLLDAGQQAVERGARLTRQLLGFARREAVLLEPTDIRARLLGMSDLLARALRADIVLDVAVDPGLWPVEVDPTQFELAVLNLAINARDALPHGGRLRIAATNAAAGPRDPRVADGDSVRVTVADTGSGMTPEVLARVFEPFFTTKPVGKGSGLGLSQVHGFARQSGGTVEIESEPGRGTTVSLLLPRSDKTPAATLDGAALSAAPGAIAGKHILMVEDDPLVAGIVGSALVEMGFNIRRAANAEEALSALEIGAPDLLFTDVVMPGMNGVDLAREARRRYPRLPVLLATGYSEDIAAAGGTFSVLAKPYQLDTLAKALLAELGKPTLPAAQA